MGATTSHETYLSSNTDIYDGNRYSATFKEDYFAEGACRYAFKGTLSGSGRRNRDDCVTKVFKEEFAKNFVQWAPDLAASKKAFGFAQEFAKEYMPKIRNRVRENEIEFLIPLIAKMKNIKHFDFLGLFPILADERYVQLYEYVAIEPYIVGDYDKFNSNGGYEKGIHELMTAFCHWTWYISGHRYMVCDLQVCVYLKKSVILSYMYKKYNVFPILVHYRNISIGQTYLRKNSKLFENES